MNEREIIREKIGIAIGEASMCWSETPKGVFDSTRASEIVQEILNAFQLEAGMGITRYAKIKKDNHWLAKSLENFYPFNGDLPKGLGPTAYQTLSYEGDKKLLDKFNEIKTRCIADC